MTKPADKTPEPKHISLTIDVAPFKNGNRKIIVAGAPAGEMPIVHTGTFADLHALINTVWAELQRRAPQVPKIEKDEKAKTQPTTQSTEVTPADEEADSDEASDEATSSNAGNDQLVVSEPANSQDPTDGAEVGPIETPLPEIAGDPMTGHVMSPLEALTLLEMAIQAAKEQQDG